MKKPRRTEELRRLSRKQQDIQKKLKERNSPSMLAHLFAPLFIMGLITILVLGFKGCKPGLGLEPRMQGVP